MEHVDSTDNSTAGQRGGDQIRELVAAPPALHAGCALFVDFDGTLVEFEDDPDLVVADAGLQRVLAATHGMLQGALALVSGRAVAQIDRCLAPARYAVAGVHGLERRSADGVLHRGPGEQALRRTVGRLRAVLAREPRIRLEDKGDALAIHFRRVRAEQGAVQREAEAAVRELGAGYRLLSGADVLELLPAWASKGGAVRAFMCEPPFAGRIPVFVGDDVTDLDGFRAARDLGGYGIAVGDRVSADYHLEGVAAVLGWLRAAH